MSGYGGYGGSYTSALTGGGSGSGNYSNFANTGAGTQIGNTFTQSVTPTYGGSGTGSTGSGGFFSSLLSPQALKSLATLGGAGLGYLGNTAAANTVANSNATAAAIAAQSQAEARAAYEAAQQQGIAAINQGTTNYTNTVTPLLTEQAITLPEYRGLTEQQQLGEDALNRNSEATLASSGLAGAGRAGVAAVMNADANYEAQAHDQNQADTLAAQRGAQTVQNTARQGLAGVQAQAGGAIANTDIGAGNQIGSSFGTQGNISTGLQQNTGNVNAAATAANGSLAGSALGGLAGITAASSSNPTSTDPLNVAGDPNSGGLGGSANSQYSNPGST